ncbi:hypothetical protein AXG93_4520s1040 [Marchantia polymorpha subsp. ruderalis]|uniref:Uncharacterized protein n=1 Tax=Marchantia polymorpha subsp. ruderalis TaxID=1480154 RepID=A0A176VTF3_MARPO|nr:hypothetical protein AXG93_4520s1040 [Marchantia polymorpha subsp. ruderalis]
MTVEEWRLLGQAIRDNDTATTVEVWNGSFSMLGLQELACAASSDEKDPVLHLEINPNDYDELMSALNLLGSEVYKIFLSTSVVFFPFRWQPKESGRPPVDKGWKGGALEQNQKQAVYMTAFREARLQLGDAKAGRLLEQSEKSLNYIDVLMLCSEHKSKEAAVEYVLKHIVQELISFCASSKGCPGLALVLGVIQTMCVEMLISSHLRGAILIKKLQSKFLSNMNDKLGGIALDGSQLAKEQELLNYEYTWSLIPSLQLKATSERATNLLWERDVEAVVNEIRQKRNQQLESLQQSLISLNNDLAQSHHDSENTVSNSSLPHIKDCNPASTSCSSQASTSLNTQLVLSCA